ncbi:hypothetical protein HCA58_22800 [Micromonospora sp. HNM0581]|uniref:hypothetical protein n=1 Tax=Micromonospora sp. HNM0581 TaxID=2716341 RepID=UPI00146C2BA7|nr:hypothetical protein [Micromonospora sp. HNM0581]NLU81117.1 hypothetical protein [Micromonospora sp. HNM0581]
MNAATWRVVGRAFPGPMALAVWMLVTVPAPLIFFEGTHSWEEDLKVSTALWWIVGAVPVLAAVVATKWTRCNGQRRTASAMVAAVVAATLVSAVFVGATMAVYRWVVPLSGVAAWRSVLFGSVPLAICGAAVGYLFGRGRVRRSPVSPRRGFVLGGIVAVVGALLAETSVQLGAESSTVRYDAVEYGAVGPYATSAREQGVLRLPAAGRYAIFAVGHSPRNPDCQVTGVGVPPRSAKLVTIAPGDYGSDYASFAWVASFDVPVPGAYSLSCRTYDQQASYTVGEVPQIRGAVGALIHWPSIAIWLLGAIPGLLIIADTARRRARRRSAPGVAVQEL